MFIYVSYSANIVVLLQSTTKINTIEELVESRIEVGGEEIHYMKNYFEVILSDCTLFNIQLKNEASLEEEM